MNNGIMEQWNKIYEDFINHYPKWADKIISWTPSDEREIAIYTESGVNFCYDFYDKGIRFFKDDKKYSALDYSEEEWRDIFKRKLDRIMRIRGCDVDELSELSGISTITIYKYLRGDSTPSGYNTYRIALALDCSVGELSYEYRG